MNFEQYATARLPVLLGTARAICGETALAEDIVQDVLIKLHARWDKVEPLEQRDAYVRRMLVNEYLSWRRKWARFIPHAVVADEREQPDQYAAQAERDALLSEVRRLPRRQRVVIGLRYFADLSDADIAQTLGCSQATVRVHASRALTTLRTQWNLIRTEH